MKFLAATSALIFAFNLLIPAPVAAQDTLDDIKFPPVEKAPWRFDKFPIMAWWCPPGGASIKDFENYRDAGFSIYVLNPDEGFFDAMDKATSVGLPIMSFRVSQGFSDKGIEVDYTSSTLSNIVSWITSDEPGTVGAAAKTIGELNALMRQDPTRWAMFNCLPPHVKSIDTEKLVAAAVRNGAPIISYDNYVILEDGNALEAQHYAATELYRRLSLKHDVPFWAFALTIKHFHYRRASESDVRWKQFTNLAYGAKGLWYFTYWGPTDWDNWDNKAIVNPADGSKTELYGYVKAINENVQSMGQVLLNLTNERVMHTTGTGVAKDGQALFEKGKYWISDVSAQNAIVSLFRHKDGTRYAMIVNCQHGKDKSAAETSDTVSLKFAPDVKGVTAVAWLDGKPGPLEIQDGAAKMPIAGGTGVLLRLDKK